MKTRRVKTMTTRNRTRTTKSMQKSQPSLMKSNGSQPKTLPSLAELNNASQQLPDLENINMSQNTSQSQNLNPSQNLSQSQKNGTSGTELSAGAKRKLTADEVKFAKLNNDLKENVGSIGAVLLMVGQARKSESLAADGMVILQHNEKLCNDLTALAEKYEYVYNGLNTLVQVTVWGAVISDVAAIAMAIAANHGMSIPGFGASNDEQLPQAA